MKKLLFFFEIFLLNICICNAIDVANNISNGTKKIIISGVEGNLFFQIPICNEWIKDCYVFINDSDIGKFETFISATYITAFKEFEEELPFDMYIVKNVNDNRKTVFKKNDKIVLILPDDSIFEMPYAIEKDNCGFIYIRNLRLEKEEINIVKKREELINQCKKELAEKIISKYDISEIPYQNLMAFQQSGGNYTKSPLFSRDDFVYIPELLLYINDVNRQLGWWIYLVSFSPVPGGLDSCFFIWSKTPFPPEAMWNSKGYPVINQKTYLKFIGTETYLKNYTESKGFVFQLSNQFEYNDHKQKITEEIKDIRNNPHKYLYILSKSYKKEKTFISGNNSFTFKGGQ